MSNPRYRVFRADGKVQAHPDNRWYVYDYLDGALARLRDGSLAYAPTRALAQQIVESLTAEPVWTPTRPTYGSLSDFKAHV